MYKKIAFVAHEFGFFKGHGGVASYLASIVAYLLNNYQKMQVYLLVDKYDENWPMQKSKNLHISQIRNEDECFTELSRINPDYIETMDFLGWCTRALMAKRLGLMFQNTVFALMHHTGIRESCEWNTQMPIKYMQPWMRNAFMQESAQIMMADIQIAPSSFMAKYVKRNYAIADKISVFVHHNELSPRSKEEIISDVEKYIDLIPYKNCFNVIFISRIEGRKNQIYLVREFCKFLDKTNANARLFLAGNSSPHEITSVDKRVVLYSQIPRIYRDKITIFDFMNQKQQMVLAAIGDVSVLPSFYESFSMAMLETLYRGVPLIVTKNSGVAEFIQPEWQFDPFTQGALCEKLELFYKTNNSMRKKIHDEQIKKYIAISNPKNTIDRRITMFDEFRYSPQKPENFTIIDSKHWDDMPDEFPNSTKNFILITNNNTENISVVSEFAGNFSWPENANGKVIVLNNNYGYLENLHDAVNQGLPLFLRGLDVTTFNENLPIYQNLINCALNRELIVLRDDAVRTDVFNRKITDYVFMTLQKVELQDKYDDQ
jgi:glycosyltransferase involved in cell wall biosynthesis